MERPNIPPNCNERYFLATANYVFTVVFAVEMFVKVMEHVFFLNIDNTDTIYFAGGCNGHVLRSRCVLYIGLEYHGWSFSNNFHNRFVNVSHK